MTAAAKMQARDVIACRTRFGYVVWHSICRKDYHLGQGLASSFFTSAMLFYLSSRLISAVVAFLYPGYASYKTLSQRPASEEDIERWLMYWSVLGCVMAVEYTTEWIISWIPFYYLIKTLFLLYLALPQTRGSSYLYVYQLQPFFQSHENQIDATLASLRARAYEFLQNRARLLWDSISASLGQQPPESVTREAAAAAPPSMNNPWGGPAQLLSSMWTTYGPSVVAAGATLLRQPPAVPSRRSNPSPLSEAGSSSQAINERRRQLEAELAALDRAGGQQSFIPMPVPMPTGTPPVSLGRGSPSDGYLRDRTTSVSGRFEEIEKPAEAQGYDAGDDGYGHSYGSNLPAQRGSWFGWGRSSSSYERVKDE